MVRKHCHRKPKDICVPTSTCKVKQPRSPCVRSIKGVELYKKLIYNSQATISDELLPMSTIPPSTEPSGMGSVSLGSILGNIRPIPTLAYELTIVNNSSQTINVENVTDNLALIPGICISIDTNYHNRTIIGMDNVIGEFDLPAKCSVVFVFTFEIKSISAVLCNTASVTFTIGNDTEKHTITCTTEPVETGIVEKLIELLREFLPQLGPLIPAIVPLIA